MAHLLRYALRAWLLVASLAVPARAAAPASGIDCACDAVGDFVLPSAPIAIAMANGITGASPGLLGGALVLWAARRRARSSERNPGLARAAT